MNSRSVDTRERVPESWTGPASCDNGPPHDQERWLAAAYDKAGIGLAEVDREGRLRRVNSHICQVLHSPADELVGFRAFSLAHPDDRATNEARFGRQVAGESERATLEMRLQRGAFEDLWVSIDSRSVRDVQGNFLSAIWVVHDITQRRLSDERLATYSNTQTAFHELTAALQRALTIDDVCAAAINAMYRSLRCKRASVLLFDGKGIMRFAAARGLSSTYMKAVEGHSPWQVDTSGARPICVGDVETAAFPEDLRQTVLQEGIGALAFIPVEGHDRMLGKFMVYFDDPHEFSPEEIETARTIARHVSFCLERMRAERAAQHLAAIIASSSDAIVSKDLNATITSWNKGAELLFGFTAEEAIGKPITIVIPLDRLDEEPRILARICAGERVDHFETVRRRRDGSLVDISLTISPIRDAAGNITGASKIARDISDRRAVERRLLESEKRAQDLISAIPAAIYTTDAEGRLTYFNEAAVEFAGRRPMLGSDDWCVTWKLFTPDGEPLRHDECPMALALKEEREIRGIEAVAERPDGTRVPFIPYPTPLRDSSGKMVGAINMLVDISQRKEAETQQRILLHELNHRVKNNMQMLQSLLTMSARRARVPEARESLEEASARVASMASAQRVLYGQSGGQFFGSDQLIHEVCTAARQAFPSSIQVACDSVHVELPNDVAMPLALILNELLTNAVKHGTSGLASSTVHVSLVASNEELELSVEDDGPGFDLLGARQSASGIQLVEGIARQLSGKLEVARSPKTRVTLRFPMGEAK